MDLLQNQLKDTKKELKVISKAKKEQDLQIPKLTQMIVKLKNKNKQEEVQADQPNIIAKEELDQIFQEINSSKDVKYSER